MNEDEEMRRLDQAFRKNLRDLEMTTLDAVIILSKTYELLMRFLVAKHGRKIPDVIKSTLDLDDEMFTAISAYIHTSTHIVAPFLGVDQEQLVRLKEKAIKGMEDD